MPQERSFEVLQEQAAALESHRRTELRPVLANVQWRSAFQVGAGLNVVTGNLMASAVESKGEKKSTVKGSSETKIELIASDQDLRREIGVTVSSAYNTPQLSVTNSNGYLQKLEYSTLDVTLMAKSSVSYEGFDRPEHFELTDEAKRLISNTGKFRQQYGDYFIAGSQRRAEFIALYHCKGTSSKKVSKFKTSISAGIPDVFSVKGSNELVNEAKKCDISISIEIFMSGFEGNPPPLEGLDPRSVIKRLNWFMQHDVGAPGLALMHHYSILHPSYPRRINIAPETFIELHGLYSNVWEIRGRFSACPKIYKEQLQDRFDNLSLGVDAQQSELPTDGRLRRRFIREARNLNRDLHNVFSRMDLYFRVLDARSTEPKAGQENTASSGPTSWMYGYSTYLPNPDIAINSNSEHWAHPWTDYVDHTFRFGGDQTKLVVGWKVVWERTDEYDGYWKKDKKTILGTDELRVFVYNSFDSAVVYDVITYWVDAKDYQFQGGG